MATEKFCEVCPDKFKKHSVLSGFGGVLRKIHMVGDINIYIIKDLGQEICRSIFALLSLVLSQGEARARIWQLLVKVEVGLWRRL